jgi:AraC-like DNA-binding protein
MNSQLMSEVGVGVGLQQPVVLNTDRWEEAMARRSSNIHHYLPVNETAMSWGVYVTGAGRATIGAGQNYPPPGHPQLYCLDWQRGRVLPEFQVLLATKHGGVFESEATGQVPIEPGSLLFIFPGVWHRYRPNRETGWTERWLAMNGELMHQLLDHVIRTDFPLYRLESPDPLTQAFDQLLDRIHSDPHQNSLSLSFQAMSWVAAAIRATGEIDTSLSDRRSVRAKDISDPIVGEALHMIWTRSHCALSVEKLAKCLATGRRMLERAFRQELGHTVLGEINACRLDRAKRLLRETDLPIKKIALLAGFPSEERMRVTFLQTEEDSPSIYRAKALRQLKSNSGRLRKR